MEHNSKEVIAAQRARAVVQRMLSPPSTVLYSGNSSVKVDDTAGIISTHVLLISSPYPRRRATLAILPHDTPVDGHWPMTSEQDAQWNTGNFVRFLQPRPLPRETDATSSHKIHNTEDRISSMMTATADGENKSAGETERRSTHISTHPVHAICRSLPRSTTSPYHQLSYIFEKSCCPFTALLATLRAAGFTRVEGRAALMHKSHSLLWVKHLMPSTVDQLMGQLAQYRKVNHFPGTHWLGRKDKLCLLMRRAERRWQHTSTRQCAEVSCTASETKNDDSGSAAEASSVSSTKESELIVNRSNDWAIITPQTWLLPQDAKSFQAALQKSAATVSTSPLSAQNLFIVKPANNAGGQGIFLLDAGHGKSGVAAAEAVLKEVGALPKVNLNAAPATSMKCDYGAAACFSMDKDSSMDATQDISGFVVQHYLSDAFLLRGHKFDLRLYVVVTSFEPVRMYLYREGLVRIASAPYHASPSEEVAASTSSLADLKQLRAHLTNFTVNKTTSTSPSAHSPPREEERSEDGNATPAKTDVPPTMEPKWSLEALGAYMHEMHYDWTGTQKRIHEVLRRTFLSVTPEVRAELRAATARRAAAVHPTGASVGERADAFAPPPCTANGIGPFFEFFGVDVLLVHDRDNSPTLRHETAPTLRPVLLEVNILPSLSTHYSLFDQRVKANFIADALTLVGLTSPLFKTTTAASSPKAAATNTAPDGGVSVASTEDKKNGLEPLEWISSAFPNDVCAREACYTAAEEQRRGVNFTPLLPTRDSAERYAPLMVDASLGVSTPSRYDAVLSGWAAAQT